MTAIIRVAIIDDDKAVLEALSSSFRFRGLEVHAYEGAQQFLDALDAGLAVDCVVSDVRMPGIDGLSLHRILSERRISAPFIRRSVAKLWRIVWGLTCFVIPASFAYLAIIR